MKILLTKPTLFALPMVIAMFFASCDDPEEHPAKELGSFDQIQSNGNIKFRLITGPENKVISTSLDDISYYVSNGVLHLNASGGTMTIAMRDIKLLWCNACTVENPEKLIADRLTLYVHAGGVELKDIEILEYLGLEAVNTGQYEFSGSAAFFNISTSNHAAIKAFDLVTDSTHVKTTSIPSVEVHATEVVNVIIMGAGDVCYKGDPPVVRLTRLGSGRLIKK